MHTKMIGLLLVICQMNSEKGGKYYLPIFTVNMFKKGYCLKILHPNHKLRNSLWLNISEIRNFTSLCYQFIQVWLDGLKKGLDKFKSCF